MKYYVREGLGVFAWTLVMGVIYFLIGFEIVLHYRIEHRKKVDRKIEKSFSLGDWWDTPEYERMKRLHQYHGTLYSWRLNGVDYFFTKDGRVAELWDPRSSESKSKED